MPWWSWVAQRLAPIVSRGYTALSLRYMTGQSPNIQMTICWVTSGIDGVYPRVPGRQSSKTNATPLTRLRAYCCRWPLG